LLAELGALHDKKQQDYGTTSDPFANIRASAEWGMAPWVGALMRANDKMHRLQQFARRGTLENEGAEDSMKNVAVYALIALVLYRESTQDDGGECCQAAECEHAVFEEYIRDMSAPAY